MLESHSESNALFYIQMLFLLRDNTTYEIENKNKIKKIAHHTKVITERNKQKLCIFTSTEWKCL